MGEGQRTGRERHFERAAADINQICRQFVKSVVRKTATCIRIGTGRVGSKRGLPRDLARATPA